MPASRLRKRNGQFTEPDMPPRTILDENGITVENYYRSRGDHAPPHLHVLGKGEEVRIGQNGHPLENDPPLSAAQDEVVQRNINVIRKAIRKIGRWYWFHVLLDREET